METMQEIWKSVKGYEGMYEVSNLGRMRSVTRVVERGHNIPLSVKGRILKFSKVQGYSRISLSQGFNSKQYKVHRLVAQAFIPNPDNKPFINHIDGVRDNNCVTNLEWCTQSENLKHAYKIGNKIPTMHLKKDNPKAVRVKDIVTNKEYKNVREAAEDLNIKPTTLRAMLRGENKNKTNIQIIKN